MQDMDAMACDVVLLPTPELGGAAINMSRKLSVHQTLYVLNAAGPFPHVSLYMVQLQDAMIGQAKAQLAGIAANNAALRLTAARYDQTEGYIDADYGRLPSLVDLQMEVIDAINPLRDGLRKQDRARLPTDTGIVRANIEQYGYRGVGDLFRPHLSLTRFANGSAIDVAELPSPDVLSGLFVALGLFQMGDNGTCVRQIASFPLGG